MEGANAADRQWAIVFETKPSILADDAEREGMALAQP